MGLMRSRFVRAMAFQSTTMFFPSSRWFMGSLEFLTGKFRDLSQQEPESSEVTRSGTTHLPPAPVRFGLICEVQLRYGSSMLGKTNLDPTGDKADHTLAVLTATIEILYQPSLESDSECGGEVYMVGQEDQSLEKTAEEI
jgi:hypothetical protein